MNYRQKLLDPRWQRKRLEVLQRADFECECCGDNRSTLHVHHRRYIKGRDPWDYESDDLFSLCEACHGDEHDARERLNGVLAAVPPIFMCWERLIGLVAGFLIEQAPEGQLSDAQINALRIGGDADAQAFEAGRQASATLKEAARERFGISSEAARGEA